MNNRQVVWHPSLVTREQREVTNGHKAAVVWFTGLPGSGKSTTAHEVERQLFALGCQAYVFDGDNVRHGLSADLGFSPEHRNEHLRRMAELSRLVHDSGMIVLCAFVSPTRASRDKVRALIPEGAFFEAYCRCRSASVLSPTPGVFMRKPGPGRSRITPACRPLTRNRRLRNWCSIPQRNRWHSVPRT